MVSVDYEEAISDVLYILKNSDDNILKKIPNRLIEFFEQNKSKTYIPDFDFDIGIEKLNLKDKTKALLAVVYSDYLCSDTEREEYLKKLEENEKKYQQELREKYNPEEVFKYKTKIKNEPTKEIMQLEVKKENWFIKFIKRIFKF